MGTQVAAVHRGHIARVQGLQGFGVVPVQEVPLVPLHGLQGGQRGFEPVDQFQRADPAELARAAGTQQVQPDVGRRCAVRHHFVGAGLQVVGRQVVVLRVHAALEQPPGVARHATQQIPVCGRKAVRTITGPGRIGTPHQPRRQRPEPQQRHHQRPGHRGTPRPQRHGAAQRQRGRRCMPAQRGAQARG